MVASQTSEVKCEVVKRSFSRCEKIADQRSKNKCVEIHLSVAAEWQTGLVIH